MKVIEGYYKVILSPEERVQLYCIEENVEREDIKIKAYGENYVDIYNKKENWDNCWRLPLTVKRWKDEIDIKRAILLKFQTVSIVKEAPEIKNKPYPNNVTELCKHSREKFIEFSKKHDNCYWTQKDEDGNTPEDWEGCTFSHPAELRFGMTSIGSNPYVICKICREKLSLYCFECDNP